MSLRVTRYLVACAGFLACAVSCESQAQTRTVRVVTYNIEADTGGFSTPRPGLIVPSAGGTVQQGGVLEGIGEQNLASDPAQPLDILALQETTSNSMTVAPIVNGLNSYYNAPGMYAMSTVQAGTSGGITGGGGPNALVYNTTTLQLLASVKVDPPAGQSLGANSGEYREVMRYLFAPVGVTPNSSNQFYVYVSHYKSGGNASDATARAGEATIIRNDEASNLPADARALYVGDYNVFGGSSEAGYQIMVAATAPDGITQGRAFDLLNVSGASGIDWSANSLQYTKTESSYNVRYRDDMQLMTSNVFYGVAGGLALVPGTYHPFGNNGTTPFGGSVNLPANTALTNLMAGASISAAELLQDLTNAADHLPVVADYTIPLPSVLVNLRLGAAVASANVFRFAVSNEDGTTINSGEQSRISIYTSTNPAVPFLSWSRLTNSIQLTNGFLQVTDTNVVYSSRFYRAVETP
jgi:hypothetical protein